MGETYWQWRNRIEENNNLSKLRFEVYSNGAIIKSAKAYLRNELISEYPKPDA